ncbi:hypothetical protein ACO1O0_001169 [Amphichorda felina]
MPQVQNKTVGPIGFGLMAYMEGFTWRADPLAVNQAIKALKAAVESGATFWNGAEVCGTPEYNSMALLNRYFAKYPEDAEEVTLTIKGGAD